MKCLPPPQPLSFSGFPWHTYMAEKPQKAPTTTAYGTPSQNSPRSISHLPSTMPANCADGRRPKNVFWVGSLGAESIRNEKMTSREELEKHLNFKLGDKYMVATFHPVTTQREKRNDRHMLCLTPRQQHSAEDGKCSSQCRIPTPAARPWQE